MPSKHQSNGLKRTAKHWSKQRGQGMLEYMIMAAVVGIFCLGVSSEFGDQVKTKFTQIKKEVTAIKMYKSNKK